MYKAVLIAVAAAALIAPATAQQNDQIAPTQSGQITPSQNEESAPQNGQEPPAPPAQPRDFQAPPNHAIAPDLLSEPQIRAIQQALDSHGTPVQVDGQWGSAMDEAIMNFQKNEYLISQNGVLDPLTLMALGLNPLAFGLSDTTSETTGQASPATPPRDQVDSPDEHPPANGDQDDR